MVRVKPENVRGKLTGEILRQNTVPILELLAREREWRSPSDIARKIGGEPKYITHKVELLKAYRLLELKDAGKRAGKDTQLARIAKGGLEVREQLQPIITRFEGPA